MLLNFNEDFLKTQLSHQLQYFFTFVSRFCDVTRFNTENS